MNILRVSFVVLVTLSLYDCRKPDSSAPSQTGGSNGIMDGPVTNATTVISAEAGGVILLKNMKLTIPQGALEQDTEITASITSASVSAVDNVLPLGQSLTLTPEGLQFLTPVELEMCYTTTEVISRNLNEKSIMVYYAEEVNHLVAMSGIVDQTNHCVTGSIEHFSTYIAGAQALSPGNSAPNIGGANFLPTTPLAGIPVRVRTTINDFNGGSTPGTVVSAFLYYRVVGAPTYTKVTLQVDTTDDSATNRYYGMIPAASVTLAGIETYFEATDILNMKRTTTPTIRTINATATALRYNPTSTVNLSAGFQRRFTMQADDGGTWRNISADAFSLTGAIGTVVRTGPSTVRFSATTVGTGSLNGASGTLNGSTNLTVQAGLLDHIEIMDSSQVIITSTLNIQPNATFQFDALGYDAFGNTTVVSPAFTISGGIGSINPAGLFTAGTTAGLNGSLTADVGGLTDIVNLHVPAIGESWTERTLPGASQWFSVTYGNGVFVAVAYGSIAATSPDGITWTARTMPTSANWCTVTYGNGIFLALTYGGSIAATSPDGITWTVRNMPSSANWLSAAYGNGIFVAVASPTGTLAATSPDGITWTARTMPTSGYWISVTYANNLFVAIAYGGASAATSPDGITWTNRTMPTSADWSFVTYGNGIFLALATSSSTLAATSSDGIAWTARNLPSANTWNSAIYGNGTFVAVGAGSTFGAISSDGITWTATQPVRSTNGLASVTYGNGVFVSVGSGSTVSTSP